MSESKKTSPSSAKSRRGWSCGLALLGGVVALVLAIAGCGSTGGSSSGAAVEVAGKSVSTASVAHWIPIEAVISKESVPKHAPVAGEIPDPPRYSACIAYQRSLAAANTPGAAPSPKQLTAQCRQRYQQIRQHVLQILISFRWLDAEAAQMGVEVSDQEVAQAFAHFKAEALGGDAGLRKYLKYTGATLQDELLVVRMDELSTKIQTKVLRERGLPGARKYYEAFPKRWAAKTSCQAGYIVPECKQYKGSQPPEPSI